ncbi:MAG: DUF1015 domain-containing protein, partial [Deltaproteobacteria bacterium]|nr:DUF1015 domain-containing protein [Deltaproteobacteria bacterium]
PDLKAVVTPPHDIISPEEQEDFYGAHPQNMIRLILGKMSPEDTDADNRYTRAAKSFRTWLDDDILQRDKEPAFYVTEMDYTVDKQVRTRLGFVAVVELHEFEEGIIRPHEKTFSATTTDRLNLIEACKTNFSPIFSLFADPPNEISELLRTAIQPLPPDQDFEDLQGFRHRLWRITDPEVQKGITERLADRAIYIADGHHRYGTALTYRNKIKAQNPALDSDDSCNFVMMYLTSMHDPGLALRPVHRVVREIDKDALEGFVNRARTHFDVKTFDLDTLDRRKIENTSLGQAVTGTNSIVIGAAMQDEDDNRLHILQAKEGVADRILSQDMPESLRKLDVTVVTKLVVEGLLGLNGATLDDERSIQYVSTLDEALHAVHTEKCPIALIINPTRLDQLQEVSDAGLIMPRKSTYFYPKVMTGLVINKIDD